eukprot:m.257296 g.257296  ORF g.257296 m.257296 type:complete len:314 (+) comp20775_c0_seq1:68-1009(+)
MAGAQPTMEQVTAYFEEKLRCAEERSRRMEETVRMMAEQLRQLQQPQWRDEVQATLLQAQAMIQQMMAEQRENDRRAREEDRRAREEDRRAREDERLGAIKLPQYKADNSLAFGAWINRCMNELEPHFAAHPDRCRQLLAEAVQGRALEQWQHGDLARFRAAHTVDEVRAALGAILMPPEDQLAREERFYKVNYSAAAGIEAYIRDFNAALSYRGDVIPEEIKLRYFLHGLRRGGACAILDRAKSGPTLEEAIRIAREAEDNMVRAAGAGQGMGLASRPGTRCYCRRGTTHSFGSTSWHTHISARSRSSRSHR